MPPLLTRRFILVRRAGGLSTPRVCLYCIGDSGRKRQSCSNAFREQNNHFQSSIDHSLEGWNRQCIHRDQAPAPRQDTEVGNPAVAGGYARTIGRTNRDQVEQNRTHSINFERARESTRRSSNPEPRASLTSVITSSHWIAPFLPPPLPRDTVPPDLW